jgi:hypothetical protein
MGRASYFGYFYGATQEVVPSLALEDRYANHVVALALQALGLRSQRRLEFVSP